MTSMPWGPPKPRNAVFDALCVLAMRPFTRMLGIQYALSMWHSARDRTGSERSRLQPPSAVKVASRATMRPPSSNPTRQSAWNPWRLPDMVRSCVRFSRTRTGRPVSTAPRAAIAANPCGCISLPPKPPPMRRHCTVISWLCLPSTCATISWVSDGCWVLLWTKTCSLSSTWASAQWVSR